MVIVKVLKGLRNNWKKSTFAAGLLTWGGNYLYQRHCTSELMRAYCEEAKKFGDAPILTSQKPRHVTVILNPTSRDGKGKKLFEMYSAPLLNLAGIKLSIIQTEHEGQATDLMEIMENTDAVIIAGGNGTLHEAITGLLRRNDQGHYLPLGIVPIGVHNDVAKNLYWKPMYTEAAWIADATMAVIRENTTQINVARIDGAKGKPVFTASSFDYGALRDIGNIVKTYWYFGPLKLQAAYFFQSFRDHFENRIAECEYILPCSGCSVCYIPTQTKATSKRWWEAFVPRTPNTAAATPEITYSNIVNNECGKWNSEKLEFSNLSVASLKLENNNDAPYLEVTVLPPEMSKMDFIKEGIHWFKKEEADSKLAKKFKVRELKFNTELSEGEERWFSIDDENYEVQNIHVQLLPKKVKVFTTGSES